MNLNFNMFIQTLQRINSPMTNHSDLVRILSTFQKEVNINFFHSFQEKDIIAPFKTIWQIFLIGYPQHSPQIKLMISRNVGVFLSRLISFYPKQLMESFFQTIKSIKYNAVRAPLIISCFAFIVRNVNNIFPIILENEYNDFIYDNCIFEQFSCKTNEFSEHFVPIISNLSFMGHDWLKSLLSFFLEEIQEINDDDVLNRHIVRAISALITFFPIEFVNIAIDILKDKNIYKFLPVFSFFFFSYYSDNDEIDMKKIPQIGALVKASFNILANDDNTHQNMDDALQLLSSIDDIKIEYLELNEGNGNSKPAFKIIYGDENIIVLKSKLEHRSIFYRLPLPFEFLNLDQQDNILTSSAKLSTLSKYAKKNQYISQITSMLNKFLRFDQYNEFISSILKILAKSLNYIKISNEIIHHILFFQSTSWFHSMDILSFIKALRLNNQMPGKNSNDIHDKNTIEIDENMALEIIDLLIEFSLNKNSRLSKESSKEIINFTNLSNFKTVINKLIHKIFLYEKFTIEKLIPPLSSIVSKYGLPNELYYFVNELIEIIDYMKYEFSTMCAILDFIICFNNFFRHNQSKGFLYPIHNFEPVITISEIYIIAIYEIITGFNWGSKIGVGERIAISKYLKEDIERTNIDIIAESNKNFRSSLRLMKKSLIFIFNMKNPINDFNFEVCVKCFELFPSEISKYLFRNWNDFIEHDKYTNELYSKLTLINDYKVYSIWCNICINNNFDDSFVKDLLTKICLFFFGKQRFYKNFLDDKLLKVLVSFACYLLQYTEIGITSSIINHLSSLPLNQLQVIYYYAKNKVPNGNILISQLNILENINNIQNYSPIKKELSFSPIKFCISDNIDSDALLKLAIQSGSINNIKKSLKHIKDTAMMMRIPTYNIPIDASQVISKCILKYNIPIFENMLDALNYILTIWENVAIAKLNEDPNKLLIEICNYNGKLKKKLMLNLCYTVGKVNYDKSKLFNLCNILLYESKSYKRIRVCLRLFSTVLMDVQSIPIQLIDSFINEFEDTSPNIPLSELILCLKVISNLIINKTIISKQTDLPKDDEIFIQDPPKQFMLYVQKIKDGLKPTQLLYGQIQIIFTTFYKPKNTLIVYGSENQSDLIASFETYYPSRFLNSIQQLEKCIFSMNDPESEKFMKNVVWVMILKITKFIRNPLVCEDFFNCILNFFKCNRYNNLYEFVCGQLIKLNIEINHKLFKKVMEDKTIFEAGTSETLINNESPIYTLALKWLPYEISKCLDQSIYMKMFSDFSDDLNVYSKDEFSIFISCINKILNMDIMTEKFNDFLINQSMLLIEKISTDDTYNSLFYLCSIVKCFNDIDKTSSLIIFMQFFLRSKRFLPFFSSFLVFCSMIKQKELISQLKSYIISLTDSDDIKNAISIINEDGIINNFDELYKAALVVDEKR